MSRGIEIDVCVLRNCIENRNSSLKVFAYESGITEQTLHNILKKRTKPYKSTLGLICKALDISEDVLKR